MTPHELTPEQERQAQELAARIQSRSAEAVLAIARTLVTSTDATLFGDTEFQIRQHALGVVAYNEHLREKKVVATSARPSTARTAAARRRSSTTAPEKSNPSAD